MCYPDICSLVAVVVFECVSASKFQEPTCQLSLEKVSLALGSAVFGRITTGSQKPQGFLAYAVLFIYFIYFFPLIQCTSFIPEARAVLDLVDQCPREIQKGKFQVIAIEGLDATGK